MDKAVLKYKKRRQNRLDAKNGVTADRYDSVDAFKKRRKERLEERMDAGIGWAYGLAKSKGIDTAGMTPKEVFEALEKEGGGGKKETPAKEAKAAGGKTPRNARNVKGVVYAKSESGFEVPEFDAESFTDNIEEKKEIAREAAKELVSPVKKTLSTKINEIKRPKVDASTREYLKKTVSGASSEQIESSLGEADKIYKYWEKNEPTITAAVVDAVKDVGGSMYGLDNRRKFDKSLAKKMLADALDPAQDYGGDIALAAKGIKDGARYTAVFDTENFSDGYKKVKDALEKMGIREYRCKNFFSQYRDQDGSNGKKIGEQKSVQCVFETPDGQKFELQFHTPESMAAKEVNHPTYKQKKDPPSENVEYNTPRSLFMRDTSSVVPDPKGVFDIEEHKRGEKGYK